jgi:hypothetical protein
MSKNRSASSLNKSGNYNFKRTSRGDCYIRILISSRMDKNAAD